MEEHARVLSEREQDIERELLHFRRGEGMFFWYFWCRNQEANAFQALLIRERSIATAAGAALAAVTPLRTDVNGSLLDSAETRGRAVDSLNPTSDEGDFLNSVDQLKIAIADLSRRKPRIARARTMSSLTGLPEEYRIALLAGFERQLDYEEERVEARIVDTRRAIELLRQHKAAMSRVLEGSGGIILALENLSTSLLPVAEVTFQATHPVHEAIVFLKQPVTSGNPIGSLINPFLPSAVTTELTPFAILSKMNPQLGDQIETVELVCEVIKVFHSETTTVAANILPFAGSLREFESNQSRESMQRVLLDAPGAVESLDSLAARVEEALSELARASHVAAEIRQVGQMAGQAFVRDLADATASAADGLVERASAPFAELKENLRGTSAMLGSLEAQEADYVHQLSTLRGEDTTTGPTGPAIAESIRQPREVIEIPAVRFSRGGHVEAGILPYGDVIHNAAPYGPAPNWVDYDFFASSGGEYDLWIEYAAAEPRPVDILLNGRSVLTGGLSQMTGGWNIANQTLSRQCTVELLKGQNTLRLERDNVFPHIRTIRLIPSDRE
jgi:hypothetical protein